MRSGLIALLAVVALTACSNVISGSGRTEAATSQTPTLTIVPSAPGSSAPSAPPANPLACPHITYAAGRLAFDCVIRQLSRTAGDPVWPLALSVLVEPAWALGEGARTLQPLRGKSLKQVALAIRSSMLAHGEYGDSPSVATASAHPATVAGVPGFILQSTITINPDYRAQHGLAVRVEKLWIVTISAGDGNVAAWYVSIPDDVKELWPKVPALIRSIGLI